MLKIYFTIFLICLPGVMPLSYAQVARIDTSSNTGRRVIFEDDFSHDVAGKFPMRWRMSKEDARFSNPDKIKEFTVARVADAYALSVKPEGGWCCLDPILDSGILHTGNLQLEFDFLLENYQSTIYMGFCSKLYPSLAYDYCTDASFRLRNRENEGVTVEANCWKSIYFNGTQNGHFAPGKWHHFQLAFIEGDIKCYIDQHRVTAYSGTGYYPINVSFGLNYGVKLTRMKLTSIDSRYHFNTIISDKKFVTRAILFDVNKSEIQRGSLGLIHELAIWLKQHETVKLEIGGHTDSDGNPATNLTLSQARADEVMKQLVILGITPERLTAKGYGATKPVKDNATAYGKAENRRVEFAKL